MTEINTFQHKQFGEIRIIKIENKPYFPAIRCAEILGHHNPCATISNLCQKIELRYSFDGSEARTIDFIDQIDLQRLISGSKSSSAEKFTKWLTNEILPSVTGHLIYNEDEVLKNHDLTVLALRQLGVEQRKNRSAFEQTSSNENMRGEANVDYEPRWFKNCDKYDAFTACEINSRIVYDFLKKFQWRFTWDLVPTSFLYDLYEAWSRRAYIKPLGRTYFKHHLERILSAPDNEFPWKMAPNAVKAENKITLPEPLITEYNLRNWKNPYYAGKNRDIINSPETCPRHRGIIRYPDACEAKPTLKARAGFHT